MQYVIGIDGGGTKTETVLIDQVGNTLWSFTAGPSNPNVVATEELRELFTMIFGEMEKRLPEAFQRVTYVYVGVAGVGSEETRQRLYHLISPLLPHNSKLCVEIDAVSALYSGTFGKEGIVHISGTGSVTYGVKNNRKARVGGWGHLFGDEGSGYDIGRQGISQALKFADGRGEKTILLDLLYEAFQVDEARTLVERIYLSDHVKKTIASTAKMVMDAYHAKDAVAMQIIEKAAEDIALNIFTLYSKLFQQEESVPVVLCGGMFQDRSIILPSVQKHLAPYSDLTIVLPTVSPVYGSAIGGLLQLGIQIGLDVINNMHRYESKKRDKERMQ